MSLLLDRLTGRWRSVPAAVAVMVGALLLTGLAIIFQSEQAYRTEKRAEARVQAEILAASVSAPLDFMDPSAAADAVRAMRVNPQIAAIAVYDGQGRLFAGFAREGELSAAPGARPGGPGGARLTAAAPVLSGEQRIGTVHLALTPEPWPRRLSRYALIGLFVLLATLSVVILGLAHAALRRASREVQVRALALTRSNAELQVQMDERARAEEQLRQAQKMQALGQLTGGIAHDFNNLLTVIQSSAELIQRPNISVERRNRFAEAILQTTERAAALTAQLLAFARRQPLRPETLDLNEKVVKNVELLDRTLGPAILVETELADRACLVEADSVQLDAAIVNIAVNARDAMPKGGTITFRTGAALMADGAPAVELTVEDNGGGMDPETQQRVFDPFFTTKEIGRGTGLGLSQVYGFVTQSGGEVAIRSEVGAGTAVSIRLPCSAEEQEPPRGADQEPTAGAASGTILVVDDNEQVGAFAEALLVELGYKVVRATSGEEALRLVDQTRIDCVFTDIVMPRLSGLQLAEMLRARLPELPVVLTTGFSDHPAAEAGDLPVLPKPYTLQGLSAAIRQALPRQSGRCPDGAAPG